MIQHIYSFALIAISMLLIACDEKENYSLTKEQALKVNSSLASERVDTFGADGPYRPTGSAGFPRGAGCHIWVNVGGSKIKKEYPIVAENESYVIEQFENAEGEGFIVVYKYASK